MFERFTDQARRIVVLAQEEARMLNHNYIGTEHILLALIREGTGTAATALASLGITEEAARKQVAEITGRGQQDPPRGHIPFTPRGKKTLELSLREAIALGNNFIGTEHILLGLIPQKMAPAIQVPEPPGSGPDQGPPGSDPASACQAGRRGARSPAGHPLAVRNASCCPSYTGAWTLWIGACRSWNSAWAPARSCATSDREIAQVRRDKEAAVEVQDFEGAAVLRDGETQLLSEKAAREQEWAALPSLSGEIERLRDLLRRNGIDPQDGVA